MESSNFDSNSLPQLIIGIVVLGVFLIVPSHQTEVVPHDDNPFLELIQVFEFLDPGLLFLIKQLIVDLDHGVDLHLLEASLNKPILLIFHHRIGFDSDQWAASAGEVLHHHLTEAVVRVEHLVVQEKADVEVGGYGVENFVEFVGVDVTNHAFAEK